MTKVSDVLRMCLIVLVIAAGSHADPPFDQPLLHIVVILLDDLGYGDPGCYNADSKISTPHIDRLAAEGMRFTDAHAGASWCVPSRYALLTGRFGFRTQRHWQRESMIADELLTLPEMLKQRGYRTLMVGKWHLGFNSGAPMGVHRGGPIDHGFDEFFGIAGTADRPPYYLMENDRAIEPPTEQTSTHTSPGWNEIQARQWHAGPIAPGYRFEDLMPRVTARAEAELREHAAKRPDQPLFMYYPVPAPHTPWVPSPQFEGKSVVPLYGDYVMQTDAAIGRLLDVLEETGLAAQTLVILSSDNGPAWFDHDTERFGHDAAGGLRGMKGDGYEGGHRVPLIVRWPGKVAAGAVVDQYVSLMDVMATCAAITGQKLPAETAEDSHDISTLLFEEVGGNEQVRPHLAVGARGLIVRRGPWKLMPFRGSGGAFTPDARPGEGAADEPAGQLYNLSSDPAEIDNVYAEHPEIVRELEKIAETVHAHGSRAR